MLRLRRASFSTTPGSSRICFLKDRPKPRFAKDFPLAWDNVLYESPSLGYVNATHQKGIDYGPTVLTYYYPMCHEENGRTKLFNYEWRELADVCLTDHRPRTSGHLRPHASGSI